MRIKDVLRMKVLEPELVSDGLVTLFQDDEESRLYKLFLAPVPKQLPRDVDEEDIIGNVNKISGVGAVFLIIEMIVLYKLK